MNKMGLDIVNDKSRTHTHIGEINQKDSNLDLRFASNNLISQINCSQGDDPWVLDHYPMTIKINQKYIKYFKKSNKISTKKTNWEEYKTIMKNKEQELDNSEYTELKFIEKYNYICESIINAVRKAIETKPKKEKLMGKIEQIKPNNEKGESKVNYEQKLTESKKILIRANRKGKVKENKKDKEIRPLEWWDEECNNSIKERKEAFKNYKRNKSESYKKEYFEKCKMVKKY